MLREIVTKAVLSKGKIEDSSDIVIDASNDITKVIGCWVINHNCIVMSDSNKVSAKGFYDVHVWCSLNGDKDTTIVKKTIEYEEEFNMDNKNYDYNNCEYKLYCLEYPNCTDLKLENNRIASKISKKLAVDVIGESKLVIQVNEGENKDSFTINQEYIHR